MAAAKTAAQREVLKAEIWRLSKNGMSATAIARLPEINLNPKTVNSYLKQIYEDHARLRKESGAAENDLIEYLAQMGDDRFRALQQYTRMLKRYEKEQEIENEHEAIRRAEGEPPTRSLTRALQWEMYGLPNATRALDSARAATEARGRVLGLEAAGKEAAKMQIDIKLAGLMDLWEQEVTIEVKLAEPTPEGWDVPEEDDL